MKKNKMTVYSEYKVAKPQEHYERLLRDSEDLDKIMSFLGYFGESLRIFLRLYCSRKYDGACKVAINCFKRADLYSLEELNSLYLDLILVSPQIDRFLWKELEEEIKKKGMVLV